MKPHNATVSSYFLPVRMDDPVSSLVMHAFSCMPSRLWRNVKREPYSIGRCFFQWFIHIVRGLHPWNIVEIMICCPRLRLKLLMYANEVLVICHLYNKSIWRPPSKIITIIFSEGIRWFPVPNLVLKTIMMIKKVYGLEICVFLAPSYGATSGLSLSAVFTLFQPVSMISALCF